MSSSLCISRNPVPWLAAPVLFMVVAGILGFGFLSILITSSVLVLSTVFLALSQQKPAPVEASVKEEFLRSDQEILPHVEEVLSKQQPESETETVTHKKYVQGGVEESLPHMEEVLSEQQPEIESVTQKKYAQEGTKESLLLMEEALSKQQPESETVTQKKYAQEGAKGQMHDYLVRSLDSPSESESLDRFSTSEDSEVDWPFQDNMVQSSEFSDGSISDEDGLIEIALPSGHYVVPREEEDSKFNFQQKLPDFSSESIFKQHSLMEFLAEINEMNEEENLIEIDISMGSIKCSRFEIEA